MCTIALDKNSISHPSIRIWTSNPMLLVLKRIVLVRTDNIGFSWVKREILLEKCTFTPPYLELGFKEINSLILYSITFASIYKWGVVSKRSNDLSRNLQTIWHKWPTFRCEFFIAFIERIFFDKLCKSSFVMHELVIMTVFGNLSIVHNYYRVNIR